MRVLITGANRGLGLEFTRQYAELGHEVVACCRKPEQAKDLHSLKGAVSVVALDVGVFDSFASLGSTKTPIDLLIHNAGVYGHRSCRFGHIDSEDWQRTMLINTMAPVILTETLLPRLLRSDFAKVIAITSKMGSIADNTSGGSYVYRTSKAALNMGMKSLALDLIAKRIAVAVLHPGWVRTDMGGPSGLIEASESVRGMRAVIENLSLNTSGSFFNYDGSTIAW